MRSEVLETDVNHSDVVPDVAALAVVGIADFTDPLGSGRVVLDEAQDPGVLGIDVDRTLAGSGCQVVVERLTVLVGAAAVRAAAGDGRRVHAPQVPQDVALVRTLTTAQLATELPVHLFDEALDGPFSDQNEATLRHFSGWLRFDGRLGG